MSTRSELADAIRNAAPATWIVQDFPSAPDNISTSTPALVIVEPGDWVPGPVGNSTLEIQLNVWIAVPNDNPDAGSEDALEDVTTALLSILDTFNNCSWSTASREVMKPGFPARKITTKTYANKE